MLPIDYVQGKNLSRGIYPVALAGNENFSSLPLLLPVFVHSLSDRSDHDHPYSTACLCRQTPPENRDAR
jgi:hypothetical protein